MGSVTVKERNNGGLTVHGRVIAEWGADVHAPASCRWDGARGRFLSGGQGQRSRMMISLVNRVTSRKERRE